MEPKKPSAPFYASVILINTMGQVLLGKRREDGIWTPPGGGANEGESAGDAACRELFEEAGIICNPNLLVGLPSIRTRNDKVCHCFMYPCSFGIEANTSMDPDKEVAEFQWFSLNDIPQDLKDDPRRFESVRNAYMKYHGIKKGHSEECNCIRKDQSDKHCNCGFIKKGGPGSGQVGHKTMHPDEDKVINLTDKLEQQNPFASHLNMLQHGAVMEGEELRSGKPLYLKMDQATAHGYTPQDHKQAADIHYEKAQQMSQNIAKIRMTGKPVPKEMTEIAKFHKDHFKQHMKASERLENRMAGTSKVIAQIQKPYFDSHKPGMKKSDEHSTDRAAATVQSNLTRLLERKPELADKHPEWQAGEVEQKSAGHDVCTTSMKHISKCDCAKCMSMKKAVVMFGHQDSAEVDTAKFTAQLNSQAAMEWMNRFSNIMDGYDFGHEPRVIPLDKGDLHLVKVDDGIYSGVFKKITHVDGGEMEDNAKVRIERMTIPDLVPFCMAKEWIQRPQQEEKAMDMVFEPAAPEKVNELTNKLEASLPPEAIEGRPFLAPVAQDVHKVDDVKMDQVDRKLEILRLIEKLVN